MVQFIRVFLCGLLLYGLAMLRSVGRFVVNVDECPLYVWKDLDGILQLLTNVMCFPQRCACVHDDVDLNKVVWTAVICTNGIYLFDLVVERHRFVDQKLNKVVRGGFSGQQFEFSVDPINPSATDAGADDDGAHGIQEPGPLATASRREKTEPIDKQVVSVVLPKHLYLT